MQKILLVFLLLCRAGAFLVTHSHARKPASSSGAPILAHLSESELRHTLGKVDKTTFVLNAKKSQEDDTTSKGVKMGFLENFRDKPANLLLAPVIILFGVDIVLNLAVLTKRTFDYFVLGQAPSTEPWW